MIKLIALDLDGTLNNDSKVITPKTKSALLKAQNEGAVIVLASGRPAPGLARESEVLELRKHHGLLLSYNGGQVLDVTTNEILYEKNISNDLAKELLRHLEKYSVTPIVDDGTYIYTNDPAGFQIEYESKANQLKIKRVDRICEEIEFNPIKVLIASPEDILKPLIEEIKKPFEEVLSFLLSTPFYLEVTSKGIDKATSLDLICKKLHISKNEVIAFGDGENDISMISYAGIGVAMENSCDRLKEIADEITLSNNEDGIAYTLSKHFESIEWRLDSSSNPLHIRFFAPPEIESSQG